ncbi:MAG: hypothetical protein IJV82_05080 [Oscillospiraceae bacterium]|nr:hypothetical protein [Oscillospiraceae bacterium]
MMKKCYEKPMVQVEYFSLTQAIAACPGIKIKGVGSSQDVLDDSDATEYMKSYAKAFGFLSSGNCLRVMDGFAEPGGSGGNTICYHGPVVSAFLS